MFFLKILIAPLRCLQIIEEKPLIPGHTHIQHKNKARGLLPPLFIAISIVPELITFSEEQIICSYYTTIFWYQGSSAIDWWVAKERFCGQWAPQPIIFYEFVGNVHVFLGDFGIFKNKPHQHAENYLILLY